MEAVAAPRQHAHVLPFRQTTWHIAHFDDSLAAAAAGTVGITFNSFPKF
jgi:hypothetical protein